MSFAEYEAHMNQCLLKPMPCPAGCNFEITGLTQGKKHLDECPKVHRKCRYCSKEIGTEELATHQDVCEFYPVACTTCDSAQIPRNQQGKHNCIFWLKSVIE